MILSPKSNPLSSLEFGLIAPDKSLSHRSVIISFLTQGRSEVEGFLDSADTLSSLQIAQQLGAKIEHKGGKILITPPHQIIPPKTILQCQNSGTTARLFAGLLSGARGEFCFDGDESLRTRPMQRIITPLTQMGASFSSPNLPLILRGNPSLHPISYHSPIPSAQVKGAVILAALQAQGESEYIEDELSRDHTERFLSYLGAEIYCKGQVEIDSLNYEIGAQGSRLSQSSLEEGLNHQNLEKKTSLKLLINPLKRPLPSYKIKIPNDPSSVIFLVVACLISKNMSLKISQVLLNPTRIYAFEVLKAMGAELSYEVVEEGLEKVGDVIVRSSELRAVVLRESMASVIDEIPALCIAFACARGKSVIQNANELRVKESDRIKAIVHNLKSLGIEANEFEDGLEVVGGDFRDGVVESFGDHRIAMSFALAGIRTQVKLKGAECVNVSFRNFFDVLSDFVQIKE